MPSPTQALCGDCFEPVSDKTISDHMLSHGYASSGEWKLAAWPDDGTAVLLDFSFLRTLGK